jgi:hypothetical protein
MMRRVWRFLCRLCDRIGAVLEHVLADDREGRS